MMVSPLKPLGLVFLGSLSLAACDSGPPEQVQNTSLDTTYLGDPTPEEIAAAKAAKEVIYCPRSKQHVTRGECKRVTEIWDNLEKGKGAIDAPPEMVRDEASTVSFAVAAESSGTTVE